MVHCAIYDAANAVSKTHKVYKVQVEAPAGASAEAAAVAAAHRVLTNLYPKRDMVQIWQEELNPERNGGHNAFTIEGDRYFTKRAIASILREPAVYLWYCLQKAVYLWLGNPISDWPYHAMFNVQAMRPFFSPQRIVGILASRILPVFAVGYIMST